MRRVALALIAVAGLAACGDATALDSGTQTPKVFVCKYVGKPGVDERLQTGQNPISVSLNAIPGGVGVGDSFADAQGRSLVIAFDTGQYEPEPECPTPPGPTTTTGPDDDGGGTTTTAQATTTTAQATTTTAAATTTTKPDCPDCGINTVVITATTTTVPSGTTTTAPPTVNTTVITTPGATTTTSPGTPTTAASTTTTPKGTTPQSSPPTVPPGSLPPTR